MRIRRAGFTLVEIMTVIAIISLLAALLLPALSAIRRSATRASCGARLHDLGVAFGAYAQRYSGRFPPFGSSATQRYRNYFITQPPAIEDWTAMWASGDLPNPQMLYCPSTQSANYQFATSANPWPPSDNSRVGYSRRYFPGGAGGLMHLSQVRSNQALAADLVVTPKYLEYQHIQGVNALYVDGSVQFVTQIKEMFIAAGHVSGNPTNDQIDAVWAAMDRGVRP